MKIRALFVAVAAFLSMLVAGNAQAVQSVHVFHGSGTDDCYQGWVCLYEHYYFNEYQEGRVLAADESIPDLGFYDFANITSSYCNKTPYDVVLYADTFYRGDRRRLPAGTCDNLWNFNDRASSVQF